MARLREQLCQRNRSCMAPDNFCANVERPSPEERARNWPRVQARIYKTMKAEIARRGLEDE